MVAGLTVSRTFFRSSSSSYLLVKCSLNATRLGKEPAFSPSLAKMLQISFTMKLNITLISYVRSTNNFIPFALYASPVSFVNVRFSAISFLILNYSIDLDLNEL